MSNEIPRIEIWTRDLTGPIPEVPILGTKPQHLYIKNKKGGSGRLYDI